VSAGAMPRCRPRTGATLLGMGPAGTRAPASTPPWRYGAALAPPSALATLRGWAGTATVGGALRRKPTESGPAA
jgi:hypothetical protein